MDLIEAERIAQAGPRLSLLTAQGVDGELLDLVHLDVDAPVRGVGVAPFGSHGHFAAAEAALREPGTKELFGAPIGASRVEVADAARVGGVEHLVCAGAHGRDIALAVEVAGMAEVEVAG